MIESSNNDKPKVFCLGFHKTGTSSLAAALEFLGYSVTGPDGVSNDHLEEEVHALAHRLADQYDAFVKNPWALLYKEMDRAYPGSKFILTVRDTEDWLESVVRHFGTDDTPMREWIYGIGHPKGHEETYVDRYEQHNRTVKAYFADRPDDLLVMHVTDGDGWEELCAFLDVPVPPVEFPHSNRARSRERGYLTPRQILERARTKMTKLRYHLGL